MTDTERKEVEELTKALQESISKENSTWNSFEVVAKRLVAKGYTKRPQDNNALVPLDFQVIFDMLFDRTQYSVDSCKDIAEEICAKFGKDNSGMVPRKEYLMCSTHQVGIMPNRLCGYCELERLSQQPPKEPVYDCGCGMGESCLAIKKERKVSLEEIEKVLIENSVNLSGYKHGCNRAIEGEDYKDIAQSIKNLIESKK